MGCAPLFAELIAPCGINCGLCRRYLANRNSIKRIRCRGCIPGSVHCTYLFVNCSGINHSIEKNSVFCFECRQYPCPGLEIMDRRYQTQYGESVLNNLEKIRDVGVEAFPESQSDLHHCPYCGEMISMHNGRCFRCEPITRLAEKMTDRADQGAS